MKNFSERRAASGKLGPSMFLLATCCLLLADSAAQAAVPELPRVLLDTTYTPSACTTTVPAGGDLQAALNAASQGDTLCLANGATFTGNFVLPYHASGTGWIVIRPADMSGLPAAENRVTPAAASVMPKIVTPNTAPAILTASKSHHYRFVGVEFVSTYYSDPLTEDNIQYGIVVLGNQETDANQLPTDITLDRCYIHGDPGTSNKRGVALNAARAAVIDSYIEEIHSDGGDSQAIDGWNGPGPFKIVNNFLEGAAENLMFGGAPVSVPGQVPSDIEIRHNHFFKPLTWKQGAAIPWVVKNLLELKNGQRILIEGNVFENTWMAGQSHALVFTVRTEGGTSPWNVVQDITVRYNLLTNVDGGVNMSGLDDNGQGALGSEGRIAVYNNIFQLHTVIENPAWQILNQSGDVTFDHNTVVGNDLWDFITFDGAPSPNLVLTNNLAMHGQYGIAGSGSGLGSGALAQYAPNSTVRSNVMAGIDTSYQSLYSTAAFKIVAALSDIGYVNPPSDLHLASTSPFKNAGTDGKDLGADIDTVMRFVAGVTDGSPGPASNPNNPTTTVAPGNFSPQVYPNPWRSDKHSGKPLTFSPLVAGGTIKIFTTSGRKVREIPVTTTTMPWDLTNDKGDKVASGIYMYLITDGQGNKAKGKLAIIK